MARGRYKIFLGMAAGVGKTYRMLQEGQAEQKAGRDVAIGYLEPHKRQETSDQARGLEVVPRRQVTYRDVSVEEMDLHALLLRRPQLALIDELAHSNPPGLEHRKRYEDIADVLAAGIDVFSTVNVQHLESLNDQVAELIRGHRNIVNIKGHASLDDLPDASTPQQRMDLSLRRAQAVADYLTLQRVEPEVLRVQGCSTFEPVSRGAYTEDAQALNRRVEVEATDTLVEERQDRVRPAPAALHFPPAPSKGARTAELH